MSMDVSFLYAISIVVTVKNNISHIVVYVHTCMTNEGIILHIFIIYHYITVSSILIYRIIIKGCTNLEILIFK